MPSMTAWSASNSSRARQPGSPTARTKPSRVAIHFSTNATQTGRRFPGTSDDETPPSCGGTGYSCPGRSTASRPRGRPSPLARAGCPTPPSSARAIPDTDPAPDPNRATAPNPDRATGPDHLSNPDTVPDDIALVVETSGSTAAPKRVMLSASALRSSCTGVVSELGGHGQWLLALPAHYIAGAQVVIRSILAGCDPLVLPGEHFDVAEFTAATSALDPSRRRYTSLIPAQLARVLAAAETDTGASDALRSFDRILIGGQAPSPTLCSAATRLGVRLSVTYGSSETAGGCVYDGRPLPGVRVRILGGDIELAGPSLAEGYLGDSERTSAAFVVDPDGTRWYRTRDRGDVAADGTLTVHGRADDVFISGGLKVGRADVERAIRRVPELADALIVIVPHAIWGQRAIVLVESGETAPAGHPDEAALLTAALAATDSAGLGVAARPIRVLRVAAFPRLSSGKPDMRLLTTTVTATLV